MKKKVLSICSLFLFVFSVGLTTSNVQAKSELIEPAGDAVICKCKPFWHNTCLVRPNGQQCSTDDQCRDDDDNCGGS